jgi:NAD-dependent dihydropyrimidine dehydrogenase PreA subunit
MVKRKVIKIDPEKCTGCGLCIPNCPEGALQIIDNKARLISDLFCDGLGACIGHCPEGAINIEEREAQEYDERKVMENIVKQGDNVIKAHLEHLKEHGAHEYFKQAIGFLEEKDMKIPEEDRLKAHQGHFGCPSAKVMDLRGREEKQQKNQEAVLASPQLKNWPVQIKLVPANAPYLDGADLLIAADCVPFAYAGFHEDLLKGKILLVGCPKLDDLQYYQDKLSQIIKNNNIRSITYAKMEVPCCAGLVGVIESAIAACGKDIAFQSVTISIKGERIK